MFSSKTVFKVVPDPFWICNKISIVQAIGLDLISYQLYSAQVDNVLVLYLQIQTVLVMCEQIQNLHEFRLYPYLVNRYKTGMYPD